MVDQTLVVFTADGMINIHVFSRSNTLNHKLFRIPKVGHHVLLLDYDALFTAKMYWSSNKFMVLGLAVLKI